MKSETTGMRPTPPGVVIDAEETQVLDTKELSVRSPTNPSYLWLGGI